MRLQQDTWCSKELISVKLGDKRLNKRLLKVASDLLNHPTEPIHAASGNWQAAKAAYRLFDNDKLQETVLLQAHQMETVKRLAKSEEILLAIQDTTTLNYTHHSKKKGINKINQNAGFAKPTKGFFLHNTLLMTENGLPLGLLDQKIFQHPIGEKIDHKRRPIEEKQSFRWLESLKTTKSLSPEKTVVTIADRESDIFELFVEAEEIKANILIRAAKDRKLAIGGQSNQTLWAYMRTIPVGGIQTVTLPAHHNLPERSANLEVRYAKIILNPPQTFEKIYSPKKHNSISFVFANSSRSYSSKTIKRSNSRRT